MSGTVPVAPRRVGLALGSGSARGLAHFGVLRAIEEAGIAVDVIAGTSIGALIGAVHAAGRLDTLAATFRALDWPRMVAFFDVVLPKSGLIDGTRIAAMVREHIPSATIEALSRPYAAVATDLATGEEVVISSGDVIEAVRASISVPGIFTPVRRNGRILVDGGLVNPVPVAVARALGADVVIAVDLNHGIVVGKNLTAWRSPRVSGAAMRSPGWARSLQQGVRDVTNRLLARDLPAVARLARWSAAEPMPSIFEVLLASINIMETTITEARLTQDRPEILIRPPLGHIRFLDFDRAEEIIEIGYRSAVAHLAEVPAPHPPDPP
ncbi:patatin-like phospholipase family protein [Elioraea sp.]|uniref:patatin-like phospholipase family protein n=1 Tax=Elioraea sp. TaxID=2185103 RepID=UPI003F6FF96F